MMKFIKGKQFQKSVLIMYMISALLFLMSIDLHIHVHGDKVYMPQELAVHISSIAEKLTPDDDRNEVNISPNGVLKLNQNSLNVIAVIMLATLIAVLCYFECVARLREKRSRLPRLPFHGTPTLRGPPVFNS